MFFDNVLKLNSGETYPIFPYKGHVFSFGETMIVSCESEYVYEQFALNPEYEAKIEWLVQRIKDSTVQKKEKEISIDNLSDALSKYINSQKHDCFVDEICPVCHGDKIVKYTFTSPNGKVYEHEDVCPECNGLGIAEDKRKIRKLSIGKKTYNLTDIIEAFALSIEMSANKFTIVSMEGSGYAIIQFGFTVAAIISEWEFEKENEEKEIIKLELE